MINYSLSLDELKLDVVCLSNSYSMSQLKLGWNVRSLEALGADGKGQRKQRIRTLNSCASGIAGIRIQFSECHDCGVVRFRRGVVLERFSEKKIDRGVFLWDGPSVKF